MRLLLFIAVLILTSCEVIDTLVTRDRLSIEPIPISNQKGFAGSPTDEAFILSTFEHDDPTNILWWDGNIGIQQAGILSGQYSMFVNGVDAGVYSYVDSPSFAKDYGIQFTASIGYDSDEANQYGIIFDYQNTSNYGLFFITGYGEYSVGYFEDVVWYPLAMGRLTNVNLVNRSFTLSVHISQDSISPAFNDLEIVSVQYKKNAGQSGIYLGSRISDTASLLVDEYAVSPLH